MKKLLLLSLVLLCSLSAWTAQRSPEEALSIARTFFMQSSGAVTRNIGEVQLVAVSNDLLKSASTRSVEGTAFYIYNYAQSAYVIVSGDDRMKPVLGYSDNGSFITENLGGWNCIMPLMLNWVMPKKRLLNLNCLLKQVFRHLYLLCWGVYAGIRMHRTIMPVLFINKSVV